MQPIRKIAAVCHRRHINCNHFDSLARHTHNEAELAAKPYEDIPSKRGLMPAAWDLLRSGGPGYLHEHCDRRHSELGPIFRERLGQVELVFLADTKMIQTVIAHEGPRPHHNVPEAWTLYNQTKRIERGLFFQVGEPWLKLRRAFNKALLAEPTKISRFTQEILDINSNLFDVWESKSLEASAASSDQFVIQDVKSELCKWSIETTGLMLFGSRMHCIPAVAGEPSDLRAQQLVNHVATMFAQTSDFQIIPCQLAQRLHLPVWRRFEAASDGMLALANDYANEFIAKARRPDSKPSLVRDLIDLNLLSDAEISRSMVDLIIAAADTTSNSLQWMLYCLAKYPEVQETLRSEIQSTSYNINANQEIKQTWPQLVAFVKEVSRLYPTAPFLARTLDHDVTLGGYKIPAAIPIVFSLYTTSRMSSYFADPLSFKLERWLRQGGESKLKPFSRAYASLPFGVGARMCIGRRMADLEMHLLLASFLLRYSARLEDQQDVKVKLKMILSPDRPIKLRITKLDKSK